MKVTLSGFNLDIDTIDELKTFLKRFIECVDKSSDDYEKPKFASIINRLYEDAVELFKKDNITPETISAAYARISRNPKNVSELRTIARQEVEKARKSNKIIIFGLGHNSVAEHAVFNFDITGVSRYAVETIEHFRLASYTEKSQRYILFKNDYVIPEEIRKSKFLTDYRNLIEEQNKIYHKIYKVLEPYFLQRDIGFRNDLKSTRILEGLAREDARYVISLATETQLGITVNARSLENIIAKCKSSKLEEIRNYANNLYKITKSYAPSIVKYTKPTKYLCNKISEIDDYIKSKHKKRHFEKLEENDVILFNYSKDVENKILATILFKHRNIGFNESLKFIKSLNEEKKYSFFKILFENINPWDSVLREFEFINFNFQLIVSASNFSQLKRHRMVNIVAQDYDIDLGVTIPESVIQTNQLEIFQDIINKTNNLFSKIQKSMPDVAPYILTNAHKRRVLCKMNFRELYHFSRLREDIHAQWDIRNTAKKMSDIIRSKFPLSALLLGGKDQFNNKYMKIFKR